MKLLTFSFSVAVAILFSISGEVNAGVVVDVLQFNTNQTLITDPADATLMVNTGGLAGMGGRDIANGDDSLRFLLTIDDSAGTSGATFNTIATFTGLRTGAGNAEVRATGGGDIFFAGGQTTTLNFSVGPFTETTSTGTAITFDGIVSATITAGTNATGPNADGTVGALAFTNADFTTAALTSTLTTPAADGTSVTRTGGNFTLSDIGLQFTITPVTATVPEPSSLAVLGVLGGLISVRRRR